MVAGAVVENKKRKRSHADKRGNNKKQEVSKEEAKPVAEVEPVQEKEEAPVEQGKINLDLDRLKKINQIVSS